MRPLSIGCRDKYAVHTVTSGKVDEEFDTAAKPGALNNATFSPTGLSTRSPLCDGGILGPKPTHHVCGPTG